MDKQHQLSKLARQLQSDQDRKKYIKVIEMSKIIQAKLDLIQQDNGIVRSTRSTLNRKSSAWTLSQDIPSYRSSAISDNATIVAGSSCGDYKPCYDTDHHTFKVLDRATCIKFRHGSLYKSKSIGTILLDPKNVTPKTKRISFSIPVNECEDDDGEEEEEEEEVYPATIHVAMRKNASLYKIKHKDSRATLVTHASILTPPTTPIIPEHITAPQITRVYMKSKSLFKRSYQLNQYTVINHTVTSYFKAINLENNKHKVLLKLVILPVDEHTPEHQKRFGFTFGCKQRHSDAKFAVAPDSLVREALLTWINSQNTHPQGAKADDILRDGRKIYVIYDPDAFKV